jgi:glycosyltransferase involved in cell wall biosynthesis
VIHVGSTLGEPTEDPAEPLLPAPVLFSPFAAGLSWQWIVAAVRAIRAHPPLIVIGGDADAMRRHHVARRWFDPRWECRGFLPPAEVLAMLARARLVLAPFLDGLTGRRTSALAALSVGAPLVSSRGHLYDALFDQSPATLADTESEFASAASDTWARGGSIAERHQRLRWYRQHLDPEQLDARLLQLVTGAPAA